MSDLSAGLCQCGCGTPTRLASATRTSRGWIKGQPLRFIDLHRNRLGTRRPIPVKDRIWTYIEPEPNSGCWLWVGRLDGCGYGVASVARANRRAPRVMFELLIGPIPPGLTLDHRCRMRRCVNPRHLEPVTQAVNIRRGLRTKLTADDVAEIRRLVAGGTLRHVDIAARFGVGRSHVGAIALRKKWA